MPHSAYLRVSYLNLRRIVRVGLSLRFTSTKILSVILQRPSFALAACGTVLLRVFSHFFFLFDALYDAALYLFYADTRKLKRKVVLSALLRPPQYDAKVSHRLLVEMEHCRHSLPNTTSKWAVCVSVLFHSCYVLFYRIIVFRK